MTALDRAAEYVMQLAAQLRVEGHEVSSIRRASMKVGTKASPLDLLQAQANRVRLEGFARFEAGCKSARVMAHRSRQRVVK
jgi:hypothetical protein